MGIRDALRRILRPSDPVGGPAAPDEPAARSVDTALIIEAARLVVTTRTATRALLMRQLYVTDEVAERLLARLEHCEIVSAGHGRERRRVLTTAGQLPAVVAEFRRRDGAEPVG
ncbi:DNA translocase FtsK [Frondihabitans peucedani]|uniref:FtsK gamma domain-containing protein n=1 Tax=Frondihabitans peucedani TaxID=598626 RepID=A0ABP8DY47_9MICO